MIRPLVVLLVLAAAPASAMMVAEDPAGDAQMRAEGQTVDVPRAEMADLIALDVEEDDEGFLFRLTRGPTPDVGVVLLEDQSYHIHFRHGAAHYAIEYRLYFPLASSGGFWSADLYRTDADGVFLDHVRELQDPVHDGDTSTVHVARDDLRDEHGVPPQNGRVLEDFHAVSQGSDFIRITVDPPGTVGVRLPDYVDRMPDEGVSPIAFASTWGPVQEGDINLGSGTPLRWSNGEATAFVYEVVVQNVGSVEHTVTFQASEVPDGWHVVPPPAVLVAAGTDATVEVVAHVPFQHQHGQTTAFVLHGRSADDAASVGRIELGVHYPEVPQPTGHHDTLYLHARQLYDNEIQEALFTAIGRPDHHQVFMNTLVDDPEDERIEAEGQMSFAFVDPQTNAPYATYTWLVPLQPGLRMGLDMDTSAEGAVQVTFASDFDLSQATLGGHFFVAKPEDVDAPGRNEEQELIVATLRPDAPSDLGQAGTLVATIVPTEAGDQVPFDADQQLYLELLLTTGRPDVALGPNLGARLVSGSAVLPLQEYHDTVAIPLDPDDLQLVEATRPRGSSDEGSRHEAPGVALVALMVGIVTAVAARRRT